MNKTTKLTYMSLLTAVALIIFMVEAQIPPLTMIPGIKLGLANIVTVFSMFWLGPMPTLAILMCRVALGSIFSGQVVAFFYSLGGGIMCYLAMLVMRRLVTERQLWICSAVGAMFHNIGQIAVAVFITRVPSIALYLPILLVTGTVAGVFTGICAQLVLARLRKQGR